MKLFIILIGLAHKKKYIKIFCPKSMEGEKNLIWGIQGEQEAIEEGAWCWCLKIIS